MRNNDLWKVDYFTKTSEADRTKQIKGRHERHYVRKALDATEGYIFCGVVATGLLQILTMLRNSVVDKTNLRYLRTPSRTILSKATVADYLRRNIFQLLANNAI